MPYPIVTLGLLRLLRGRLGNPFPAQNSAAALAYAADCSSQFILIFAWFGTL